MEPDRDIRVVHVGLGQIGAQLVRRTAERAQLRSVAAVDPDPQLVGRTLAEICGDPAPPICVHARLDDALADGDADVAFHAVASRLETIEGQLLELIAGGLDVVTTAEELIWPHHRRDRVAERIDAAARERGVAVVAAGVNPGVLMDRLPAYMTSLCLRVDGLHVFRLVDLAARRDALRRKMGVGESVAEVKRRIANKSIGHVGLEESLRYLESSLGWCFEGLNECLEPVVAATTIERGGERVETGDVLGLDHQISACTADGRQISLRLVMRLDADEPVDEIRVEGNPPICARLVGGVNGDLATVATVLNAAAYARDCAPGLVTRMAVPTVGL